MIKKYRIKWRYVSSLGGPWMKGDVIEIDESLAEALNRDSPGVVSEIASKEEKKGEEKSTQRIVEGVADRMVKGKEKR